MFSSNVEISNFKSRRCQECGRKTCGQSKTGLCNKCCNRKRWLEKKNRKSF